MIEEPPSEGAIQLTVDDEPPPAVAETPVGASGFVMAMMIWGSSVIDMTAIPSVVAVVRRVGVTPITE